MKKRRPTLLLLLSSFVLALAGTMSDGRSARAAECLLIGSICGTPEEPLFCCSKRCVGSDESGGTCRARPVPR